MVCAFEELMCCALKLSVYKMPFIFAEMHSTVMDCIFKSLSCVTFGIYVSYYVLDCTAAYFTT